ncbi:ricin-type beta-trefoil lectin protein [Lentzea atacamensis]|uniref:Ricin-type beta-trefoil lectin protein n=1 Tax=Lentzea atacamensis TaxID=531938 RepID=A0A316HUH1_9PSEU|nr:ricin-type beta-trefoil lectin domain protein [Lentzea atacamensis]PWK83587.1 ricin-type beta-trefoil lectin protein [Lentzea atacamensis]
MTFRGILLRLAGSVTAVALMFTAAPAVATAAPQAESLYWIRFAAGVQRCLDANLEGSVYTHACQDRNTYQQWDNYALGKFRHKRTGLCLAAGTSSVFLASCSVNASDWTTSSTTNKYIMNKSTGLCLDNDGGQAEAVGLRVCRAGTALWTMTRLTD